MSVRHRWCENPFSHPNRLVLAAICSLALAAAALAEQGVLHLRDGRRLRGDITQTPTEVILRNEAGELRFPLADVLKIELNDLPPGARRPTPPPPPTSGPARGHAPPEPDSGSKALGKVSLIGERDLNRLRLYEFKRDGEPEKLRVKFLKKSGQRDVVEQVALDIEGRPEITAAERHRLEKGKPHEQLQVILAATDMRYAERIEIEQEPKWLDTFRKRVMPMLQTSCARSGCHGGEGAVVFRLPTQGSNRDLLAATDFLLLDRIGGKDGLLIDRASPERSLLIQYALPPAEATAAHPAVKRPLKMTTALQGKRDTDYIALLEWIRTLRLPHPQYEFEYEFPEGLPTAPPDEAEKKTGRGTSPETAQPEGPRHGGATSRPTRERP